MKELKVGERVTITLEVVNVKVAAKDVSLVHQESVLNVLILILHV